MVQAHAAAEAGLGGRLGLTCRPVGVGTHSEEVRVACEEEGAAVVEEEGAASASGGGGAGGGGGRWGWAGD